jgi:hypothetical protein
VALRASIADAARIIAFIFSLHRLKRLTLALMLGICVRLFVNVLPAWCADIANCCYAVPKYCSLTLN